MKKSFLVILEMEEDVVDGADLFVALSGNWDGVMVAVEPAAQQSFAPDVAKYCPQCGNKYDGVLCGECDFTTSPRR